MQHPQMLHEKFDHFQIWANNTQQGGQTHATCYAPQCWDMLRWNVAIVWPELNSKITHVCNKRLWGLIVSCCNLSVRKLTTAQTFFSFMEDIFQLCAQRYQLSFRDETFCFLYKMVTSRRPKKKNRDTLSPIFFRGRGGGRLWHRLRHYLLGFLSNFFSHGIIVTEFDQQTT